MEPTAARDEDWETLTSFFPADWRESARQSGALKGLRQDKSADALLRPLLIHLACGCSLRESVVWARQAGLADLSDVALLKRLRKSRAWLHQLCTGLFAQRGPREAAAGSLELRLLDATLIKEPGPTGSQWRLHYSVRWPSLRCDFLALSGAKGERTGESLTQFPVQRGDCLVADRGYSQASGLRYAAEQGAWFAVRLNPHGIRLLAADGERLDLPAALRGVRAAGQEGCVPVLVPGKETPAPLSARICLVRKSAAACRQARARLHRRASKNGQRLQAETLVYARYVMVLTNLPADRFTPGHVLSAYRVRWQIELVFKRLKQLARLGHLPKRGPQSAQAWLYGKLFVTLLTEKLAARVAALPPQGQRLGAGAGAPAGGASSTSCCAWSAPPSVPNSAWLELWPNGRRSPPAWPKPRAAAWRVPSGSQRAQPKQVSAYGTLPQAGMVSRRWR